MSGLVTLMSRPWHRDGRRRRHGENRIPGGPIGNASASIAQRSHARRPEIRSSARGSAPARDLGVAARRRPLAIGSTELRWHARDLTAQSVRLTAGGSRNGVADRPRRAPLSRPRERHLVDCAHRSGRRNLAGQQIRVDVAIDTTGQEQRCVARPVEGKQLGVRHDLRRVDRPLVPGCGVVHVADHEHGVRCSSVERTHVSVFVRTRPRLADAAQPDPRPTEVRVRTVGGSRRVRPVSRGAGVVRIGA